MTTKPDIWCVFNEMIDNPRQLRKIMWILRDAIRHHRNIRVIIEHIEYEVEIEGDEENEDEE